VQFGGQYTHLLTQRIEVNFGLGVSQTFASQTDLGIIFAGAGPIFPGSREYTWMDYETRVGFRLTPKLTADVFVLGTAAMHSPMNGFHYGGGLRFAY